MIAIGTETNGSILCPSQANGIVGIKPTVGLISRSGIIPISFTLDTPGPMARSVADAAACLSTMVGIDSTDSKTLRNTFEPNFDYTQYLNDDGLEGKRIGLYLPAMGIHYKVDTLMEQAIDFLKEKGAKIIDIPKIYAPVVEEQSFEVMLFEYKDGLNNYFKSLGENSPIKTLDDLIAFNETDSIELKYFDQAYLKMANEKDDFISAVAEFCRNHIIAPNGAFISDAGITPLQNDSNGKKAYTLVSDDACQDGSSVHISQKDIRSVQLGKSALVTGIEFLLKAAGYDQATKIIIAGAFGTHIEKEDMLTLGMIPNIDPDLVEIAGNSAGAGAVMVLCDDSYLTKAIDMSEDITTIDLATNIEFQKVFVDRLSFPFE